MRAEATMVYLMYYTGIRFLARTGIYLATVSRPALGPIQSPIQWEPGTLSQGVKRSGREAEHSSPCSAQAKNAWNCKSTPPYTYVEL
jgi:hypothetical protein